MEQIIEKAEGEIVRYEYDYPPDRLVAIYGIVNEELTDFIRTLKKGDIITKEKFLSDFENITDEVAEELVRLLVDPKCYQKRINFGLIERVVTKEEIKKIGGGEKMAKREEALKQIEDELILIKSDLAVAIDAREAKAIELDALDADIKFARETIEVRENILDRAAKETPGGN